MNGNINRLDLRCNVLGTGTSVQDLNHCITPEVPDARPTGETQVKVHSYNRTMTFHCQSIVARLGSSDSPELALTPALAQILSRDLSTTRQLGVMAHPVDANGDIRVKMVRLEVEAYASK